MLPFTLETPASPRAHYRNQRLPSSRAFVPKPSQPPPLLPSSQDNRKMSRVKHQQANKQTKNVATSQKSQPMHQTPTAIQELRKDWITFTIPETSSDVRPHFLEFKELLKKFLLEPHHNRSRIFRDLVMELIMCSKHACSIHGIQNFIQSNLEQNVNSKVVKELMAPHERMSIFWLLAETYRPEYDACFQVVRQILKADELFQEFLRKFTVQRQFVDELRVIWSYWKKCVPEYIRDRITPTCHKLNRKNIVNSDPNQPTCDYFYKKNLGYSEFSKPSLKRDAWPCSQKHIPIVSDNDSHNFEKSQEASKQIFVNSVSMPVNPKINATAQIVKYKKKPPLKTTDYSKPLPRNDACRSPRYSNPIYTIDFDGSPYYLENTMEVSNQSVLLAGSMQVFEKCSETTQIEREQAISYDYCWSAPSMAHLSPQGSIVSSTCTSPQPVSPLASPESVNFAEEIRMVLLLLDKLVTVDRSDVPSTVSEVLHCFLELGSDHQLSDRISKETKDILRKTLNNSNIIRILWVIGYLFLPEHKSKVIALKTSMEKNAALLFWTCLKKTQNDTSIREEMCAIFKFWCEIVNHDITSAIMVRIKDENNMNWILDDKRIQTGTRIEEFYNNKHLLNALNTGLGPKAKKTQLEIILDKSDLIQTTSNQKNWEDKLAAKLKTVDSLPTHQDRALKKQKTGNANEGQIDKICSKFHQVSSKRANLDKPLLRTTIATGTGDSSNFSGSGNQEQLHECGGLSKLVLIRKKMEKDEAIVTIGGGPRWNDKLVRENTEIYLRQDWTRDEFVNYVCSDEFRASWDIVKLESGELRVKVTRSLI